MTTNAKAFNDDPFVDKHCPGCDKSWPDYVVDGTGQRAVRCAACGTVIDTFGFEEGYTVVFDEERRVGMTVTEEIAHRFALDARDLIALPATSEQVPILLYEPSRISSTLIRLRPSIGNIGPTPTRMLPRLPQCWRFWPRALPAQTISGPRRAINSRRLIRSPHRPGRAAWAGP